MDHSFPLCLEMPVAVMALPDNEVEAVSKLVFCAFYGHMGGYTLTGPMSRTPPTIEQVSEATGYTTKEVERAINNLRYHELIDNNDELTVPTSILGKSGRRIPINRKFMSPGTIRIQDLDDDQ